MISYSRQKDIAKSVAEATRQADDLKTAQTIGNDNLIIRHYEESLASEFVNGAAIFEARFVFVIPSTSYVQFSISWETEDLFDYEQVYYDGTDTLESTVEHSLFLAISIPDGGLLEPITATADSTQTGVLTLTRVL